MANWCSKSQFPSIYNVSTFLRHLVTRKQSPSAALAPQLKQLHDLIVSRKREFRSVTEARVLADGAGIVDTTPTSGAPHDADARPDATADEDDQAEIQESAEDQAPLSSTLNPESLMQLRKDMTQRLEYVAQFCLH